jgi:hypothetical protein
MDAWWPLLVRAEFAPTLGADLYGQLTSMLSIDNPAGPQGSAFDGGWYSYVDKDMRTVLGDDVHGKYPLTFCGAGKLADCRSMLLSTLQQAVATPASTLYQRPGCVVGDQFCSDEIAATQIGGIGLPRVEWQNRPTFQQVVQFASHRREE